MVKDHARVVMVGALAAISLPFIAGIASADAENVVSVNPGNGPGTSGGPSDRCVGYEANSKYIVVSYPSTPVTTHEEAASVGQVYVNNVMGCVG